MRSAVIVSIVVPLALSAPAEEGAERRILDLPVTATEGDWSSASVELLDTAEAEWSLRIGDIDNMNAGWRIAFNPFKGGRARELPAAWEPSPQDPPGIDRVMVIRGARLGDEFSTHTPADRAPVESITMYFLPPRSAIETLHFQCFISGLDQRSGGTPYSLRLNGESFPEIDAQLRVLNIPDHRGTLLTLRLPRAAHALIQTGNLELAIDADQAAAANGYAIDFVRLLVNVRQFARVGAITGAVRDGNSAKPLKDVRVSCQGRTARTGPDGTYRLDGVAAGTVVLTVEPPGLPLQLRALELNAGETRDAFFSFPR